MLICTASQPNRIGRRKPDCRHALSSKNLIQVTTLWIDIDSFCTETASCIGCAE
ncbi:Uncharacterised protein [Vibrio cholerae]|nr:Uncharacterised protein [Vibrio cholerae]CSI46073.1 Uncharacterised protein [Vibrio cholerae]